MAAIDRTYIKQYSEYRAITDWCKSMGTVTDDFGNKLVPYDYIPRMGHYDDDLEEYIDDGEYTEEEFNKIIDMRNDYNIKHYATEECWKATIDIDKDYAETYDTFEKWCEHVKTMADFLLWNTDHIFDIWLIRNCPFDFIQNRLKEQYGGSAYNKTSFNTDGISEYDAIKNYTSTFDTYSRPSELTTHFNISYSTNSRVKSDDISWWITAVYKNDILYYDNVADRWYSYFECYIPKSNDRTYCSYYDFTGNMSKQRLYRLVKKWKLPKGTVISFIGDIMGFEMKRFDLTIK